MVTGKSVTDLLAAEIPRFDIASRVIRQPGTIPFYLNLKTNNPSYLCAKNNTFAAFN